jgi:hypothetical protein
MQLMVWARRQAARLARAVSILVLVLLSLAIAPDGVTARAYAYDAIPHTSAVRFDYGRAAESATAPTVARTANARSEFSAVQGNLVAAETGSETAQIGSKLEYFLGNAKGNIHNIDRSVSMERQLNSIGVFDNAEGRALLEGHLRGVFDDASSVVRIQENGRVVRDGLLVGPRGVLKTETVWDGNRLITGTLFGR